jgi:hypothetical protein
MYILYVLMLVVSSRIKEDLLRKILRDPYNSHRCLTGSSSLKKKKNPTRLSRQLQKYDLLRIWFGKSCSYEKLFHNPIRLSQSFPKK